jgi:hypothetical protein
METQIQGTSITKEMLSQNGLNLTYNFGAQKIQQSQWPCRLYDPKDLGYKE